MELNSGAICMSYKLYIFTIVVILIVHSLVSFCCYEYFVPLTAKHSFVSKSDITTPDEKARGEMTFAILNKHVITKVVPVPLIIYIWSGYASVAVSLVIALYKS